MSIFPKYNQASIGPVNVYWMEDRLEELWSAHSILENLPTLVGEKTLALLLEDITDLSESIDTYWESYVGLETE